MSANHVSGAILPYAMLGVQQLLLGGALVYILWGHTYIVTALGVVTLVAGALIVYVWKIKAREAHRGHC